MLTSLFLAALLATPANAFHVYVAIASGDTITLDVEAGDSIEIVKAKIEDAKGILPERQRLFYDARELDDGRTLSDYNVQKEHTLALTIRQAVPALSWPSLLLLATVMLGPMAYYAKCAPGCRTMVLVLQSEVDRR